MIAIFLIVCSLASAMAVPKDPMEESLRALLNPTPEVIHDLHNINNALQAATGSLAYSQSQAYTAPPQSANMQLSSANLRRLSDLIQRIVRTILTAIRVGRRVSQIPSSLMNMMNMMNRMDMMEEFGEMF